jgi:hypothetical protein
MQIAPAANASEFSLRADAGSQRAQPTKVEITSQTSQLIHPLASL